MTLAWHIIRKDLRLLRWVLPVWLVFSLFDAVNRVLSPAIIADDQRWMAILPLWIFIIGLAYILQLLLLIGNQIQAERLVGTTAFWLTRPIPRGTLLLAKLLGLALFVVLPTLAIEGMLMASHHVPLTTILAAWAQQAGAMGLLMLAVVFAATLTSTPTRMLILIICVIVGFYIVLLTIASIQFTQTTALQTGGPEPRSGVSDPSDMVVFLTAVGLTLLAAIWHHYMRRRAAMAVMILVVGLAAANVLLAPLAAHISLFGGLPTLPDEPWARDSSITRMRLRSRERGTGESQHGIMPGRLTERTMRWIAAPVVLEGLPSNYTADAFTVAAQVRYPDGDAVVSERATAQRQSVPTAPPPGIAVSPTAPRFFRTEMWPMLLMVPEEATKQYGDRAGHYTGTFIYFFRRLDTLATMPLLDGAGYQDGPRSLRITSVRQDREWCVVTYRVTGVNLLANALTQTTLTPRFYRRDGYETYDRGAGGMGHISVGAMSIGMGGMFMSGPHPLQVFDLDYHVAMPTYGAEQNFGPPCDDLTLVIERSAYAGSLTRTLELPDFRMNEGVSNAANASNAR